MRRIGWIVVAWLLLLPSLLTANSGAGAQDSNSPESRPLTITDDGMVSPAGGTFLPVENTVFEVDSVTGIILDVDQLLRGITGAEASVSIDYGMGQVEVVLVDESGVPGDAFYSVDLYVDRQTIGNGYISHVEEIVDLELHDLRRLGPIILSSVKGESEYAKATDSADATHVLIALGRSKFDLSGDNWMHELDRATQEVRSTPEVFTEGIFENLETPPGAPDPENPSIAPVGQPDQVERSVTGPQELRTNSGHDVIDISIIYTPAARTELGSDFSQHARALTQRFNDGFDLSDSNIRVRLVHSRAAPAPTANENDAIAVRDEAAGLNGNTSLRNTFNFVRSSASSDVTLIITESGTGSIPGVAQGPLPGPGAAANSDNAHAVMYLNITGAATVGAFHELTHLLGADHRYDGGQPSCSPLPNGGGVTTENYARGYAWSPVYTSFLLSSAHNGSDCPSASTQGIRLSNPGLSDGGEPTGTSSNDNARAVDRWGDDVGNFRTGHFCKNDGDGYGNFVARHYDRITGKFPSASQVSTYRTNMEKTWRPVDTVNNILINHSGTMQDVLRMYDGLLGRPGDYSGSQGWVNHIHNGQSLEWLASNFLASPEGVTLHGSTSNTQFITYLYQNALNRNPDSSGLNFWVGQLNNGMTRSLATAHFVAGAESKTAIGPDARTVAVWFGIFHSGPSQASVNYWRPNFVSTVSNWGGVLSLFNSGSFAARVTLSNC